MSDDHRAICTLKARYCRYMDTQDWERWHDLFTADVEGDYGDSPEGPVVVSGRDALVAMTSQALREARTVHHVHMPEISFEDENHASGIWAMEDIVERPDFLLHGFGHYHERYRREDGVWRISHVRLTRLRLDVTPRAVES